MLNREQVLELGFKELPHFTIMKSLIYDIGRNREISIGCLGTPNEVMFIGGLSENMGHYEDLICIHNYDFEGYLTLEKLTVLLSFFGANKN